MAFYHGQRFLFVFLASKSPTSRPDFRLFACRICRLVADGKQMLSSSLTKHNKCIAWCLVQQGGSDYCSSVKNSAAVYGGCVWDGLAEGRALSSIDGYSYCDAPTLLPLAKSTTSVYYAAINGAINHLSSFITKKNNTQVNKVLP